MNIKVDTDAGKIDHAIESRGDYYVGDHLGNVLWGIVATRIGPALIEGFQSDDPKLAYIRMHDGSGGWARLSDGFYRIDAGDVEAYIRLEDSRVARMKAFAASEQPRLRVNAPGPTSGLPS